MSVLPLPLLSFNGIKVPLSGLQTVKVPRAAGVDKSGSRQQIYNILASSHGTAELHLLTTKKQSSDRVIIGPAFSGQLNVSESYGDSSANLAPQIIPAAPAPSIPPGLKQRFHPFGSRTMAMDGISENETDGSIVRPSLTHLHPIVSKRSIEEVEHEREAEDGKKKRKKKEKQLKVAREEVEELKVETTAEFLNEAVTQLPLQEGDVSEKRKRKKKKKAREQAEAEEVTVKVEPMAEFEEFPFQNVEVSKTKKKKKKKDREREEKGVGVEPEVDLKVEEVVIKCEPTKTFCVDEVEGLGKKKKKKKKSKNDD